MNNRICVEFEVFDSNRKWVGAFNINIDPEWNYSTFSLFIDTFLKIHGMDYKNCEYSLIFMHDKLNEHIYKKFIKKIKTITCLQLKIDKPNIPIEEFIENIEKKNTTM